MPLIALWREAEVGGVRMRTLHVYDLQESSAQRAVKANSIATKYHIISRMPVKHEPAAQLLTYSFREH